MADANDKKLRVEVVISILAAVFVAVILFVIGGQRLDERGVLSILLLEAGAILLIYTHFIRQLATHMQQSSNPKEPAGRFYEVVAPRIGMKAARLLRQAGLIIILLLIVENAGMFISVVFFSGIYWSVCIPLFIIFFILMFGLYLHRNKQYLVAAAEYLGASPEVMKTMPPIQYTSVFDDWCRKNHLRSQADS